MKDPERWLDPSSDAPDGARELLQQARPSAAIDKATLSLSAAAAAKLATTPAVAAAALPLAGKLALSLCAAAAVTAVAVHTLAPNAPASLRTHGATAVRLQRVARQPEPQPVAPIGEPAPQQAASVVQEPPTAPPSLAQEPSSLEPARGRAKTRTASLPRSPATAANAPVSVEPPAIPALDALAAEVAWLDRARALLSSDPAAALALTTDHAARVPSAALGEERELIAIDALHRLGRSVEARARADALLARHPGSLYAQCIAAMLR